MVYIPENKIETPVVMPGADQEVSESVSDLASGETPSALTTPSEFKKEAQTIAPDSELNTKKFSFAKLFGRDEINPKQLPEDVFKKALAAMPQEIVDAAVSAVKAQGVAAVPDNFVIELLSAAEVFLPDLEADMALTDEINQKLS